MIVSRLSLPWKCLWLAIVAMGRCKVSPLLSFSMEVLRLLSNLQCNDWNVRQSRENTCSYFTLFVLLLAISLDSNASALPASTLLLLKQCCFEAKLAMMKDLDLPFIKRARGRDISGISAYAP